MFFIGMRIQSEISPTKRNACTKNIKIGYSVYHSKDTFEPLTLLSGVSKLTIWY